ncbi:MAG: molybdopterin-dependent oxidoreductase, partial [Anaerolineae bacterium]|nr:molybdopterin-dependent oxidoreductase [Anaerolineae bacterium]
MAVENKLAIGQSIKRIDAPGKVTGATPYPADLDMEGQLWLKLRFSDRVAARILAVDTSAAAALPGVVAIYTAKDIPANEYGLVTKDQPVLCGSGSQNPAAEAVRCYMDCIAVVVAETPVIAAKAAKLIQVEYEDLPGVFDIDLALMADAPQVHPDYVGNTLCNYRIRKGDMDAGWAQAEIIVEGEYRTGYQEHAYLQPEAGLGYIDDEGRITVVVAGQWVHEDLWQVAHALNLPEDRIRIIYPAIGGAFGGREDMSVQIVLALAVLKLQRPVKVIWSREESMLYHHKRHPFVIRTKWGATRAGKIVAIAATVLSDAGPYNYTSNKVMANATLMVSGPYEVENVHIDASAVLTNNIPTGAFRGFGAPQAALAAENQINKLAAELGMDPVEIRLKNAIHEGSLLAVNTAPPPGVTMTEVIEAC